MITEHDIEVMQKMFPQGFLLLLPDREEQRHIRIISLGENNNPYLTLLREGVKAFIDYLHHRASTDES